MKIKNKILNLNVNVISNSSKTIYLTPRNNEKNKNICLESNKHILRNSSKLKTKYNFLLSSEKRNSYNIIPNKTINIHKDIQITDYYMKDNIVYFSPKNLDIADYSPNERIITSSSRFSKHLLNKEKINQLTKKVDKRKKKNISDFNTLIKLTNNYVIGISSL